MVSMIDCTVKGSDLGWSGVRDLVSVIIKWQHVHHQHVLGLWIQPCHGDSATTYEYAGTLSKLSQIILSLN